MDFSRLFNFCVVVDCGSISRAAAVLYCSQPALSKQIRALEEEIGYPLFQRNGKNLKLNENGEILYRFGRQLEADYNRMKAELYRCNFGGNNEVRLGVTNYIASYLLPPVLSAFKKEHPEILVNFKVGFFSQVIELLNHDLVDFAFVPEDGQTIPSEHFRCEIIGLDEMLLVFPREHPFAALPVVPPRALGKYCFLISQEKSATRSFILSLLSLYGVHLEHVQDMYNISTIRQSVVNGLGISILSRLSVENELMNGTLRSGKLEGMDLTRKLYAVWKPNKALSETSLLFIRKFTGRDFDI